MRSLRTLTNGDSIMNKSNDTYEDVPEPSPAPRRLSTNGETSRINGDTRSSEVRKQTLRIRDFLATRLKLIRIEFTGADGIGVARFGRMALYAPILLVGYLLVLAGVARVVALMVGWGGSLFLLGGAHLALGFVGVWIGRDPSSTAHFPIVEPDLALDDAVFERANTLVTALLDTSRPATPPSTRPQPPSFPPRTRPST
jgi:hypothetical protein